MSINKYGISQEDVCIWFKSHLEGHSRIQLMASLLDICLPLELRFIGTYLEYAAGKHHAHLQKWEKDANNPNSFLATDISDATTRRRLCLFLTLLHSHNKAIATKLFDVLSLFETLSLIQIASSSNNDQQSNGDQSEEAKDSDTVSSSKIDESSWNELKLLLTMSSLHPAFSFYQRQIIREKLDEFIALTAVNRTTSAGGSDAASQCEENQVSCDSGNQLLQTATIPENTLLIVSDPSNVNAPGNPVHGLLPTPLHQQLHYPQYHAIPVPANYSVHPGQPIIIPTSLTVLGPHSTTDLPSLSANVQYAQNISFHKGNPMNSKVTSEISSSHGMPEVPNIQYASFHPHMSPGAPRGPDMNDRDSVNKQPFLIPNHIIPYHVLNNNFVVKAQDPAHLSRDVHTTWSNGVVLENPHDISAQHKNDRNVRSPSRSASVADLSTCGKNDAVSCEATDVNVPTVSRPVLTDTIVVDFSNAKANMNSEYKMSYKSKLVGPPYAHVSDPAIYPIHQPRTAIVPKNMTDVNNARNQRASLVTNPLIVPHVNIHGSLNDRAAVQSSFNTVITAALTMSQTKLHSPQVYVFGDKDTLPSSINGGYIAKPANQEAYLSYASAALNERQAGNKNLLSADKLDISPISVQVHRKSNQSITVNSNHVLSPAGSKYSSDYMESPGTSPAVSPKRSPYSSPSGSPRMHRKDRSSSKERLESYSSATNWLKSLRLHKYSHKFEGYTFQMMKDLDEETLSELIVTKGAQSKFKQNIEQLIKRGFKEFGCGENPFQNDDDADPTRRYNSASPEVPAPNKLKTAEVTTMLNDYVVSHYHNSHGDIGAHPYQTIHAFHTKEVDDAHMSSKGRGREMNPSAAKVNSYEDMNGRWVGDMHADGEAYEEVMAPRKTSLLATCYNCGAKGHYGHQCIEETMEAQTYSRYAFQLDFSRRDSFKNTEPPVGGSTISSR